MSQSVGGAAPSGSGGLAVRKDLYPSVKLPKLSPTDRLPNGDGDGDDSSSERNGYDAKRKRPLPLLLKGGKNLSVLQHAHRLPNAPKTGKPRSMMGMGASCVKKKQPVDKKKPVVETYHSQISEEANAIKIKIRKASTPSQGLRTKSTKKVACETKRKRNKSPVSCSSSGEEYDPSNASTVQSSKIKIQRPRPHRPHNHAKNTHGKAAKSQTNTANQNEQSSQSESNSGCQSQWGSKIPEELLAVIFKHVVNSEGALPALIRLGEVCKLWNTTSKIPALWSAVELSHYTRDKWKTDYRLSWLLENRLSMCHHLNLSNWKVSNMPWIVERIVQFCPGLCELNLNGWKRLTIDQLRELTQGLSKLCRLDLSCTSETGSSGSCLSAASLTHMAQTMSTRLTHLTLANNKLTGLPSILVAIATHCPNLELLDLSNLTAVSHPALVPLERLQKGCPRLRVLRITNSQVVLATATTQEQVESPGFPLLEELSVACPSTDYKLVDDEVLGRLLKTSTCLRLLDVRGCIRITDSGLIKVPAWDLQHLFLSGCCVTRQSSSCLELICEKWSHSLLEVDLAWSTATQPLDAAVEALAEKGENSILRTLNLCGSSVSFEPVKKILLKCPHLESVNLSSCRALPRGMKRLYTGKELKSLKDSFDLEKIKKSEDSDKITESKSMEVKEKQEKEEDVCASSSTESKIKTNSASPSKYIKSPKDDSLISESEKDETNTSIKSPISTVSSPTLTQATTSVRSVEQDDSPQSVQISPVTNKGSASVHEQVSPQQSSSTMSTPQSSNMQEYSPLSRPVTSDIVSASNQFDSDSRQEAIKNSNSWNSGQYSPLTRQDVPTSSHPSPDTGNSINRQDIPKPNSNWNFGHFSPSVGKTENSPYSSHQSPHPSHTSPDVSQSTIKSVPHSQNNWNLEKYSPALRHEPACSSQPSPEANQVISRSGQSNWNLERFSPMPSTAMLPSPDTSQVTSSGKACNQWNLDRYSPMTRAESSPIAIPSPDTGTSNIKPSHWSLGHFSPLTKSEMSPVAQPSPETTGQNMPKSNWYAGHYSPMTRQEASPVGQQPSPSGLQSTPKHIPNNWNLGQFSPMSKVDSSSGTQRLVHSENIPNMWDARSHYSVQETNIKNDAERTGNYFGNIDQVTTTTYCSTNNPGVYSGFPDPLNEPSSVER